MPPLTWNSWNRSKGARHWMDKKTYLGRSFSSIFWDAMRLLFMDENNKPGLLYQGKIYPHASAIIAANGRRYRFSQQDEVAMLKLGNFHYLGMLAFPTLIFEGPDQEDIGKAWGEGKTPGSEIDVGFYDIADTAVTGTGLGSAFPLNNDGLGMITYFTAAVVLHEIMHNHSFHHPDTVDWNKGTDYASSLPHVAELAVLKASPYWNFFQPLIGTGVPKGGYGCCASRAPAPSPITRQSGWRWCKKCEVMFFGGISAGKCPAGGGHDKKTSGNYAITLDAVNDDGQHYWRWCNKCQGLFYAGHGAGKCPAGAGHDQSGSGDYSLVQNISQPGTQNNWRWCNKCEGLFFEGHGAGTCPAGMGHNQTGSGDYNVPLLG